MKTKGARDNFRVVVSPRRLGDFGSIRTSDDFLYGRGEEARKRIERDYQDRCEEIAADIRRHADNVGHVSVEFDQEYVCEHCGRDWTEESNTYNGGCCDKDEENAPKEVAA